MGIDGFTPEEAEEMWGIPKGFFDKNALNRREEMNKLVGRGAGSVGIESPERERPLLGMEKMIDDAIGDVLDALNKFGLSKNTVIIFTTDHGDLGGDHRFFFKGPFLYQGLINIPFLIKIPNGQANKNCCSLASSIDIPETILELAGISVPDFMQGKSLIPILKNPEETVKNDVLIEINDDHNDEKTRTLITDDCIITCSFVKI